MRASDQDKVNDILRLPNHTNDSIRDALDKNLTPLRFDMMNHNSVMKIELETLQE